MWTKILELIRVLCWPLVTLAALYWVGKPLAIGLAQWMSRATPDKFLEVLFSIPTAIVILMLLVGVRRIRTMIDIAIEKGFKAGGVEFPGSASGESVDRQPPASEIQPPLKES